MIYLHKILALVFSPLFLVIVIIIIGSCLKSRKTILIGVIILIFFSLPVVSIKLVDFIENDYSYSDVSDIKNADAIVVLGGMVHPIKKNDKIIYEFGDEVDRIIAGINLYKEKKASSLILTRGKVPWSIGLSEGEVLKNFAIASGVLGEDIILTNNVQNTEQEAKEIAKILKRKNKIILITSAYHMPRAIKIFNSFDIQTFPFPVDFKNSATKMNILHFIPTAGSFYKTNFVVREVIGRIYYNLKS